MSFHYGAFLEGEGLPPYFRGGSPSAFWDARRGSPLTVAGTCDPIQWDQFLAQVPGIAQLPPFVERELAVVFDKALCSFGASIKGQVLKNEELGSMFLPATIQRKGLATQMMLLAGWWSVYFPWDHQALLEFPPSELVWFLLHHLNSSGMGRRDLSPLRVSITLLAMQPWSALIDWCAEYGVLDRIESLDAGLLGFSWRDEPATPHERYVALREVRQACYAAITSPCMQLWVSWLNRRNVSHGFLSDIDLRVLIECSVGLSVELAVAKAVLYDARTLMLKYGFMASVEQWVRALRGAECAALIPVVCQVFYDYQVSVRLGG
jgi:hypothetical protein